MKLPQVSFFLRFLGARGGPQIPCMDPCPAVEAWCPSQLAVATWSVEVLLPQAWSVASSIKVGVWGDTFRWAAGMLGFCQRVGRLENIGTAV